MGAIQEMDRRIGVICQNCRDGTIIPIKMRVTDEDQEVQQYLIKKYREITGHSKYTMPNGVVVTSDRIIRVFECKIEIFKKLKTVVIFYNPRDQIWMVDLKTQFG